MHDSARSVVVTNDALATGTTLPDRFVVLETFVDDTGLSLGRPKVP